MEFSGKRHLGMGIYMEADFQFPATQHYGNLR